MSLKIHLTLRSDSVRRCGLGRWFGNEGGALINGVTVMRREAPESSLAPSAM